jgi:hypothetical protein
MSKQMIAEVLRLIDHADVHDLAMFCQVSTVTVYNWRSRKSQPTTRHIFTLIKLVAFITKYNQKAKG